MKRKSLKVVAAVLLAALLAADYSTGYSMPGEQPQKEPMESGESVAYDASYGLSGSTEEAMRSEAAGEQYGGRKVILTYEIRLETDAFDSLLTALKERLPSKFVYRWKEAGGLRGQRAHGNAFPARSRCGRRGVLQRCEDDGNRAERAGLHR